jgi:hypothetical protein
MNLEQYEKAKQVFEEACNLAGQLGATTKSDIHVSQFNRDLCDRRRVLEARLADTKQKLEVVAALIDALTA